MYIAHSFLGTTPLLEALGIGSMVSGHIYPRYIDGVESQVELPNGGEGGGESSEHCFHPCPPICNTLLYAFCSV